MKKRLPKKHTKLTTIIQRSLLIAFGLVAMLANPMPVFAQATEQDIGGDRPSIFQYEPYYDPSCAEGLSAAPGKGAPDGIAFPNLNPQAMATAIDKFIEKNAPNSPFKGLGSVIVATGHRSDVSPFLIVGIALKESQLGTAGNLKNAPTYNSFGRTSTSALADKLPSAQSGGRYWYKWDSIKASVDHTDASHSKNKLGTGDMGKYIRYVYDDALKSNNINAFFNKYAPPSENDTNTYVEQMKKWLKEMADLAQGGGTAPSTGGATGSSICECDDSAGKKTIFLDPGHSWNTVRETRDPSGIDTSDGRNVPEIDEVYRTAEEVKKGLESAGYKVEMSKKSAHDSVGLIERAKMANTKNVDLAVSIHNDHSPNHSFNEKGSANEVVRWVTPQEVGLSRRTGSHEKKFTNQTVAERSQKAAEEIRKAREKAEGNNVYIHRLNFPASRGLPATGNISIVQLFSNVPWVYNEVGGKGFNMKKYADGILAGIKAAEPLDTGAVTQTQENANCAGAATGAMSDLVLKWAWHTYRPAESRLRGTNSNPTTGWAAEVARARKAGEYVGGINFPGIDCGGWTTRLVIASGHDPGYNFGGKLSKGAGATWTQEDYVRGSKKWSRVNSVNSWSDLQPGDVALRDGHTFIFVGKIPKFGLANQGSNKGVASASLDDRAPMAGIERYSGVRWYRKTGN